MTQNLTLEDFYALFRESERLIRQSLEASRQSLEASRQEFDRRMTESKAEFDRSKDEYDRRIAKTERIAAQANEAVNNLSSRWGRFVESLVAPAVIRLFQERGILVDRIYQRMRAPRDKQNLEIDIFAVNHDVAVAIEVKSRLTQDHVRRFINHLEVFKTVFVEYKNHQIYGAMAAIEIDGDVDAFAENQGLFIIQQAGDSVYISTNADFAPRTW